MIQKPISREHLTRQINDILKVFSSRKDKYVRSHSARVSLITDLYETTKDIETTKNIVGHKNIKSTEIYIQSQLSEENKKEIVKNVFQKRKAE